MRTLGPVAAARRFCLDCQGGSPKSVRICADSRCPLWEWRLAALPGASAPEGGGQSARAAMRAIRRQCLGCAGQRDEVRACSAKEDCPLWRWRFGVRPQTYKAVRRRFFAPRALSLLELAP
ncbi:MAG: hypothetical protein Q4F27_01745 [Desulfovibrionaceae bacterium]|nr:hypothetical protein [Desulfovibrionaceae bacterium]